jgi:hypothetical protein
MELLNSTLTLVKGIAKMGEFLTLVVKNTYFWRDLVIGIIFSFNCNLEKSSSKTYLKYQK